MLIRPPHPGGAQGGTVLKKYDADVPKGEMGTKEKKGRKSPLPKSAIHMTLEDWSEYLAKHPDATFPDSLYNA